MAKRTLSLFSRRSFTAGLPAGLAALAAASPFWSRLLRRATAAAAASPQRLLVWYTADGTVPEWFWPASAGTLGIRSDRTDDLTGTDFNESLPSEDRPTFLLQPISGYADRTLLVRGLSISGVSDHDNAVRGVLTGTAGESDDGASLDDLVGRAQRTDAHVENVLRTGAYGNRVSYAATRELCRPEGSGYVEPSWQPVNDARRVLDAVGGLTIPGVDQEIRAASRLAALGTVRQRVEALRCGAGTPAAHRLEAYIEEVARLETLELELRDTAPEAIDPLIDPNDPVVTAAERDIRSLATLAPFVRDLAVTSLALDYAPVVTIQWGASGENKIEDGQLTDYRYDFLPGLEYSGAGDHGLAHPEDGAFMDAGHRISAALSTRDRVRIYRWFFGQLAALLDRLSSIPDGAGTLLDSTTILCVSEFGGPRANSVADQHSTRDLPYVLIGGAQTPVRGGRALELDRSHGDYLLTLARAFGSSVSRMGVGESTMDDLVRT